MSEQDDIVVYREYYDNIEASLAKAKLDAYGIPCFLTEENMAGLYPGQQALPFHVRLHIFRKDADEVSRILTEIHRATESDIVCPNCHSTRVERDFPKDFSLSPWRSLLGVFFGVFMPHKKVNHCLNCDHEF